MAGQKLEDAKGAATEFVGLLDLVPGRDQVAVVRFDTEAEIVHELSADRQSVGAAISGLVARQGTHIDRGLLKALGELESQRHTQDNTLVAVLLTDGIHMGAPGAEVVAAQVVRNAGTRLYSIGLGPDVDEATPVEVAGDRRCYYFAPDSSHLGKIYSEVAQDIGCPAEQFWGRR